MKSEEEVRQKLIRYQGMLARIEAAGLVDSPKVFLALAEHFPQQALRLLQGNLEIEKFCNTQLPEDKD